MTRKANQPFVRNAWYIAAWAEEIDNGLLARTIMNEPIVIYRDAEGNVGALEDRCCHRGAPLTHGSVTDVGLRCGYHGLTFDTKGNCVEIPGQKNIPAQAHVRHFPLVERNQILWIWMGDPALADESLIVDYPYHDDPKKWPHRKAMFQIKSNYMLMIDNLMDLTHLGYVHGKTIGGNPLQHVGADMDSHKTEKGAYFIRWMLKHDPPPTYQKGGSSPARSIAGRNSNMSGPASCCSGPARLPSVRRTGRPRTGRFPSPSVACRDTGNRNHVPLFLVERERISSGRSGGDAGNVRRNLSDLHRGQGHHGSPAGTD